MSKSEKEKIESFVRSLAAPFDSPRFANAYRKSLAAGDRRLSPGTAKAECAAVFHAAKGSIADKARAALEWDYDSSRGDGDVSGNSCIAWIQDRIHCCDAGNEFAGLHADTIAEIQAMKAARRAKGKAAKAA